MKKICFSFLSFLPVCTPNTLAFVRRLFTSNRLLVRISKLVFDYNNANFVPSKLDIMFSNLLFRSSCLALNHLIISLKYFLCVNALNDNKNLFAEFLLIVREKIVIEKCIAVRSNQENKLLKKWNYFLSIYHASSLYCSLFSLFVCKCCVSAPYIYL